ADREPRRKVHHGVDVVLAERVPEPFDVVDLTLDEGIREARRLAVSGREVVVDDDGKARLFQGLDRMAADVPGATGNQNAAHDCDGRPIEKYVKPCARICSGL